MRRTHDRAGLAGAAKTIQDGSEAVTDDPLRQFRRRVGEGAHARPAPNDSSSNPIAPVWVGECLRLAGDASAPALTLRQREGERTALSYSYLSRVTLKPSEAIEIEFVGHSVLIQGRRLQAVFEALAGQRALEIAESSSDFDDGKDDPFVETIAIVGTQER